MGADQDCNSLFDQYKEILKTEEPSTDVQNKVTKSNMDLLPSN